MTDYCTFWPEGIWGHCCAAHDGAYAAGAGFWHANLDLMVCVARAGWPGIGAIMFVGVGLFGWRFYRKARTK